MSDHIHVRRLAAPDDAQIRALAEVLCDCVAGGASVSFMQPLALDRAERFWREVADAASRGDRVLLVAEDAQGTIVGTAHLVLAQPDNQLHRADVSKMLVHRRVRRQGLAARLMQAVEHEALREGKSLLVLDTATGGDAERLYAALGWQRCGTIPGYALWPEGGLCGTTIFFKPLVQPAPLPA
ncbi:GNAT family N-acetyltransferase [Variovorax sp. PAMC 28711]|uniref:GNAT family N-acetyltransferase n=1 Tax=Variovorax sp. PAMC 28711 TaxID=1795631 RepID=UPI00078E741E|nr:GNAT family N-acetyltransferase [Variovorax sp. PAMC 28711]AMM24386.1 acetyltransferase [Variovorax sp. PAMC 28711]